MTVVFTPCFSAIRMRFSKARRTTTLLFVGGLICCCRTGLQALFFLFEQTIDLLHQRHEFLGVLLFGS